MRHRDRQLRRMRRLASERPVLLQSCVKRRLAPQCDRAPVGRRKRRALHSSERARDAHRHWSSGGARANPSRPNRSPQGPRIPARGSRKPSDPRDRHVPGCASGEPCSERVRRPVGLSLSSRHRPLLRSRHRRRPDGARRRINRRAPRRLHERGIAGVICDPVQLRALRTALGRRDLRVILN
jgi:hypothetical protein